MWEVFCRYIWYLGFVMYSVDGATINQLHLQQQPLLSQQASCSNQETLLLMAGWCFHVKGFFFVCVPKEKTLSPGQRGGYMVYIQKCTWRRDRRTGAYREMQAGTHAVLGRTGAVACCNTGFVHWDTAMTKEQLRNAVIQLENGICLPCCRRWGNCRTGFYQYLLHPWAIVWVFFCQCVCWWKNLALVQLSMRN